MNTHIRRRTSAALTATVLAAGAVAGLGSAAGAAPQVCPDGDGWTKVDLVDDGVTSLEVVAPEGMHIVGTCVKAGRSLDQAVLPVGVPSVELLTPGTNARGVPQSISHYAVLLAPADDGPQPV